MAQSAGQPLGSAGAKPGSGAPALEVSVAARLRAILPEGGTLPEAVWRSRHRGILMMLWLHVPGLFLFALARGRGWEHGLAEAALVALPAMAAQLTTSRRRPSTIFASVGLMTASAVLVHLSGGSIEAHFHFFVMVGVVTLYQDWAPFLVAIAYVVLHHGIMGEFSPQDVYNHPDAWRDPWTWASIHGFFILSMSAVGIANWRLNESLQRVTREREAMLAEAQSVARLGSWDWDTATGESRWSDEMFRLLDLPSDSVPSFEAAIARIHPDDRHLFEEGFEGKGDETYSFAVDCRALPDDGPIRWLRVRGNIVREEKDGAGPRLVGTCQDITAAKEAKEARLHSEQRYREIVETTQEGVWTFDTGYRTTFVNARIRDMLGYDADEMIGRSLFSFVSGWGGDIADAPTAPSQGQQAQYDCRLRCRDGSELWTLLAISWSTDVIGDGALLGLAMVTDITARKRAELALALARDEAVEASRLKSQFLANTSHEIRTPITVVLGMNELLLETELDPNQRKFADGVSRAGTRLLGIINDILDFSKIEAGLLDLDVTDVELPALVEEVGTLLSDTARGKGLRLMCACLPGLPEVVRTDAARLRQVLLNLASNAVKFTDEGQVIVRAARCTAKTGAVVRFEVIDTGIGISEADQRLLFQPFSQVDASSTRRHGGTGLGLAISTQLVEAMGGRIGVKSTPDSGSTFWFEIPMVEPTALAPPRPRIPTSSQPHRAHRPRTTPTPRG